MTEQQWPKGWGKGAGVTHDVLKHQKGDPVNVEPGVRVFVQDTDLTLYQGDVLEVLKTLPDESVHCVVTSPPYWGLRDYGTGSWDGGDPDCDHTPPKREHGVYKNGQGQAYQSSNTNWDAPHKSYGQECGKCGARRVDNQLGLEATPEQYLDSMVAVFREVRRVLRSDGTVWLNIGDSYAGSWGAQSRDEFPGSEELFDGSLSSNQIKAHPKRTRTGSIPVGSTLKPKDLCMIPARLALALQADGWWLRSQIVWSKPNPMPESVTDRPTTSHEFVYLLTKSPRYFFDQEAVRETGSANQPFGRLSRQKDVDGSADGRGDRFDSYRNPEAGRNLRSVWEIATQPYPEAHFATYPEELVRRCILAGTSERGCCPECGAPRTRVIESAGQPPEPEHRQPTKRLKPGQAGNVGAGNMGFRASRLSGQEMAAWKAAHPDKTIDWVPSCECPHPAWETDAPCTVLDPFFGSGTTGLVARKHGRCTIGIELNPSYCELAARRLQQLSLLA